MTYPSICLCGHDEADHDDAMNLCDMPGCRCTGFIATTDDEDAVLTFDDPEPLDFDHPDA